MIEYENLFKLNQPFQDAYRTKFEEVMQSGWYVLGSQVKEFEREFASYCSVKHCVGVANGLDALTLALKSFSFQKGAEVIVPANTYIATILSILNCDLRPVLVEPDAATYNIDPARIEEAITGKTAAIMVVHLYGKCCDMDSILNLTQKFNLKLIEDCAQAHGAKYKDKMTGTFGDYGAFSFYPTKNLGALGDGGCVLTHDDSYAEKMLMLRNYGSKRKYYNEVAGVNSRLDELQAAFLRAKLLFLNHINEHKRNLAAIYSQNLKQDFIKPVVGEHYYDVYHIYNVRHPRRDALKEYLISNGIMTEIHYPVPPHRQKAMAGLWGNQHFPISEEIHATTLSLPISYFHTEEDIHKVFETLNKF